MNCEQCGDDEDGGIRLRGGNTNLEGRVEICLDNEWGTVCNDGWEKEDASVVCRQLGFSSEGVYSYIKVERVSHSYHRYKLLYF